MKKLTVQERAITETIRTRLGMKAARSKRSQFEWDFLCGLSDLLEYPVRRAVYAVEWAYKTGRLSASASITLQRMDCWKFSALLGRIVVSGISQNEVPRFLNELF